MQSNGNENLNNEAVEHVDIAKGQEVVTAQNGQTQPKRKLNKIWDILIWVLIAVLAVAVLVRAFVYTNVTISGDSMNPTYHDKDVVRVVKVGKPSRGDVVVFYKKPVDSKFKALFAKGADAMSGGRYEKLIKRVVAVEGDSIWVESVDGGYRLVVKNSSGDIFYEDYYKKGDELLSEETFLLPNSGVGLGQLRGYTAENPLVIAKGHFFAMGDNRGNSDDSRGELGAVPLDRLFGIVI